MSQPTSRIFSLFSHSQRRIFISNPSHQILRFPSISPISPLASLLHARHTSTSPTKATKPKKAFSYSYGPPTKTIEELASGPYVVRRTLSGRLPVYMRLKAGGTHPVTVIKRIEGNRNTMLEDALQALELGEDKIRINPTTLYLEIKGHECEKAKSWLLERGF
ncbi:hypothetical protein E4U55_002987 [Claviceps digitariae]|nr:hypothetical protein E4U55_002987 [Claviceps digitariae]